jgi:hypothetical protein
VCAQHVLSQGYAFGAPIEAMAVTQTVAGITPKFVLVATSAGQMVLLDKRFLDPRRPIVPGGPQKMTTADREEVRPPPRRPTATPARRPLSRPPAVPRRSPPLCVLRNA